MPKKLFTNFNPINECCNLRIHTEIIDKGKGTSGIYCSKI